MTKPLRSGATSAQSAWSRAQNWLKEHLRRATDFLSLNGKRNRTSGTAQTGKLISVFSAKPPAEKRTSGHPQTAAEPESSRGLASFVTASFFICVFLPTLTFGTYLVAFASQQYVSEIRLVARSTDKNDNIAEGFSAFQKFFTKEQSSTAQDGQIIINYIKSRASIEDLGGKKEIAKRFSRPEIDWFSRISPDENYENIVRYWNKHVSSSIDAISNIITVRIKAYSPNDSYEIAKSILDNSESLINRISERARRDALVRAELEVERSASELAAQRSAMLEFRNRTGSIDPASDVQEKGTLILSLTLQKIELEAQMAVAAGVVEAGSVMDRQRRIQIETLDKKINEIKGGLTNKTSLDSISEKIREYDQLRLKTQFAEKLYELSNREYETSRQNISRQQIFIQTVVPASLPESATYPKKFAEIGLFFIVLMLSWGAVVLVVASIVDHVE